MIEPKYKIGESINLICRVKTHLIPIEQPIEGKIVGILIRAKEDGYYFEYGISDSLPVYYGHNGRCITHLSEHDINKIKKENGTWLVELE